MGKSKPEAPGSIAGECKRRSPKAPRVPALSEAQTEQQCSDFLALDGWRSLKTDPVRDRSRGKGFGELGMADRLYIRYGESGIVPETDLHGRAFRMIRAGAQVLWIEWKTRTDFDEFAQWYRGSGLLRRKGL
jgi:hypothetical protein